MEHRAAILLYRWRICTLSEQKATKRLQEDVSFADVSGNPSQNVKSPFSRHDFALAYVDEFVLGASFKFDAAKEKSDLLKD